MSKIETQDSQIQNALKGADLRESEGNPKATADAVKHRLAQQGIQAVTSVTESGNVQVRKVLRD